MENNNIIPTWLPSVRDILEYFVSHPTKLNAYDVDQGVFKLKPNIKRTSMILIAMHDNRLLGRDANTGDFYITERGKAYIEQNAPKSSGAGR